MIVIDHKPNLVTLSVYGEFTLADYKEFEEIVNYKVRFEGPVDLYFDLSQMAGLTLDVAWEEVKFSRAHANDFKKIAVALFAEGDGFWPLPWICIAIAHHEIIWAYPSKIRPPSLAVIAKTSLTQVNPPRHGLFAVFVWHVPGFE